MAVRPISLDLLFNIATVVLEIEPYKLLSFLKLIIKSTGSRRPLFILFSHSGKEALFFACPRKGKKKIMKGEGFQFPSPFSPKEMGFLRKFLCFPRLITIFYIFAFQASNATALDAFYFTT